MASPQFLSPHLNLGELDTTGRTSSGSLVTHRKFTECLEVSKDCGKIVWDYLMLSKTDRIPQQNPGYIDAMILTNPEQSWCNHATF